MDPNDIIQLTRRDFRFDIPCVGSRTLESCAAGNVAVLAIEAGKTLLLEKEKILKTADQQGLHIVAVGG